MKSKLFLGVIFSVLAAQAQVYKGPTPTTQVRWTDYCKVGAAAPVEPNYANAEVASAFEILKTVSPFSFYFYAGPLTAYKLKKPSSVDSKEVVREKNARIYLTVLCGEFRDYPSLVKEKIQWINKLYKLPVTPQAPIDVNKPLWSQVSANSYAPYLEFSNALWNARKAVTGTVTLGSYEVDKPVLGQLMCETKYIFTDYITKGKAFDSLDAFTSGYNQFAAAKNCTAEEKDSYYDFRGDSNFKPNSPESNGMIWYSSSVTGQCAEINKAKATSKGITDADCEKYFKSPFLSRWSAARAGLGAWLFRDKKHDSIFSSEGSSVVIMSDNEGAKKPFGFKFESEKLQDFTPAWNQADWSKSDAGFNNLMKIGTPQQDSGFAYERLRDAVNRHTDWYSSGFDDSMGTVKTEAYSPFVASSYEMSQSDQFTFPGVTVNSPSDGRKHWMFVFKVKKSNWYNTESLANNQPVDFERHWFDETSFGTNGLAKREHAWDRLGSPLEGEYDSIIYLHNITQGGEVTPEE